MRILFVSSAGGHLSQLVALQPWWAHNKRHWVIYDSPDARSALRNEKVTWLQHKDARTVKDNFANLRTACRELKKMRPDVIVSAGASVAVPFFLLAKAYRIPTIYIEVFDRVDIPSLTGRLLYPIATQFCVQWDEQLAMYPRAEMIGPLI